jgi:hypothetical protein
MTRKGKIARLPLAIREELNRRLQEGEPGTHLVEWLNGLPKVQAVMTKEFEGQPIAENNLSAWKTGGYLGWEQDQATRDELDSFMEKAAGLQKTAKSGLTDRMANFLAVKMALELNRLDSVPDGAEKARSWRELRLSLLALRRSELYAERLKIERDKHPKPEKPKEPTMTPEEKEQRIRQIMGTDDTYDGSKNTASTRTPEAQSASIPVNTAEAGQ